MNKSQWLRRRALALAVAAVAVVAIASTALAGHQTSGVKHYTGCLVSGDGVMIKIKEGTTPKSACSGGQVEAHFSGGDITSIAAQSGGGLVGGGDNGAVGLSLRRDCGSSDVLKWNGSAWACAADSNSTYSAGTGLDLAGGEFSIETGYRVKNTPDCPDGEFAHGFGSDGLIQCDAPASSTSAGFFSRLAGVEEIAGTETVLSKNLPAGNYLLFAHVVATTPSFDDGATGHCNLGSDQSDIRMSDDPLERNNENMTLLSGIVHPGGVVALTCTEDSGNFDVDSASFAAIKLDSIG